MNRIAAKDHDEDDDDAYDSEHVALSFPVCGTLAVTG